MKKMHVGKRPRIGNTVLKEDKVGGLTLPEVKTCYKATLIKTVWYGKEWTNRSKEQNREPRIDPHKYSWLIFDKGVMTIQWSKYSLLNRSCWNNWTSMCEKLNLDIDLTPFPKIIQNGSQT